MMQKRFLLAVNLGRSLKKPRTLSAVSSLAVGVSSSNAKNKPTLGIVSTAIASFMLAALLFRDSKTDCDGNKAINRSFVADVVAAVSPSVVNILCTVGGKTFGGTATGSGFVISKDGFIVTNAHVVENSSDGRILVTMKNNKKYLAKVHSMDKASDIALVKLDTPPRDIPCVTLGSSSKLRAGDFVVGIGSPMSLQDSASFGIVSAVARHAAELGILNSRSEYIQTDAAINVGNSGGPLVNMDSEVVGINSMTVKGGEGLSFAIPMDVASEIIKQLMRTGKVVRPYVGLKMAPIVEENKRNRRLSVDIFDLRPSRLMVLEIVPGSPAELAGFVR